MVEHIGVKTPEYTIEQQATRFHIEPRDGADNRWYHLNLINKIGNRPLETGYVGTIEAYEDHEYLGQISVQWDDKLEAFRLDLATPDTIVNVHAVLDDSTDSTPVGVKTARGTTWILVDLTSGDISGSPPEMSNFFDKINETFGSLIGKPSIEKTAGIQEIRSTLEDAESPLLDGIETLEQKKPDGDGKDCERDRKIGWGKAIGLALLGGAVIATGGWAAIVGAVGGGLVGGTEAAKTENEYKECKDESKKEDN